MNDNPTLLSFPKRSSNKYQPLEVESDDTSLISSNHDDNDNDRHYKPVKQNICRNIIIIFFTNVIGIAIILLIYRKYHRVINPALGVHFPWHSYPTIVYDELLNEYQLYSKYSSELKAIGKYITSNVTSNEGWNELIVKTTDITEFKDNDDLIEKYLESFKALGHLEGYLTCNEIGNWYLNFYNGIFKGHKVNKDIVQFLIDNHQYMARMANKHYQTSEHWLTVKALLNQLQGLVDGFHQGCPG